MPFVLLASLRHTYPSRKAEQGSVFCHLCASLDQLSNSPAYPFLGYLVLPSGPLSIPEISMIVGMVSLSATDCYIVHEIYSGENAQDQFEYELEQALEAQYKYIVIEPTRIGDETARWITVGNCLHKTAVLAGTACLFTPLALPLDYSHYVSLPAGVLSLACCTLYGISWQFDPCCKYQVEYDAYKLSRLPLHTLTSSTPVVLVRKDDLHRKRLHNTIALAALVYCVKKVYELYAV